MRTEDLLHIKVSAALYWLCAVIMFLLSMQNYRYGLYPLVYAANIIAIIFMGLGVYYRLAQKDKRFYQAKIIGLSVCLLLIANDAFQHSEQVKYWAFPIALLGFVTLKHHHAVTLSSIATIVISLCVWYNESLLQSLIFASSFCLLSALASTYAQLQQQRNRTLVELEIRDNHTKSYNYRHLEDTLNKELCRADRTGKALSLVAIEIDYFPQVIDVHGDHTSQDLLAQLAECLRSMIRAGDSQYFDGKHTFYLLLPCTPSEGVVVIAERIRRTVQESHWPVVDSITISLGCTTYQFGERECNVDVMINDANIALIEALKNGHNRVCHH